MLQFDAYGTLVAASLVLLLGRQCVKKIPLLQKYAIPDPIAGGLLVALMFLLIHQITGWEAHFDTSLRDPLMLTFFASIGLNANLASLRAGGKVLIKFLFVVIGFLLLQNTVGIDMAKMLGLEPLMGLLVGT
ncbi:TPA: sodium/glutamate symporter, partial [Yersinia enterocolitica]